MSEIKKPTWLPGDLVYLKDRIRNSTARMSINDREVKRILLQDSYTIIASMIEFLDRESFVYSYIIRPKYFGDLDARATQLSCREFEICSREEAIAILKLIDANK